MRDCLFPEVDHEADPTIGGGSFGSTPEAMSSRIFARRPAVDMKLHPRKKRARDHTAMRMQGWTTPTSSASNEPMGIPTVSLRPWQKGIGQVVHDASDGCSVPADGNYEARLSAREP
jgi:hypothetical protein